MSEDMSRRYKKGSKRRKKKNSLVARFLTIVVSMVLVFVLVASTGIFLYSRLIGFKNEDGTSKKGSQLNIMDILTKKDITLNIALFGVDEDGTRTDVMMVAHFDSKTGNVSMISVPRDTRVEIPDAMYTYLSANNKYIPYGSVCKINEVHAYAGKDKAAEYSILSLEELLGIEIDHYVKVNFEGFVDLVDLVGGVDFYVPQDMYWDMTDTGDILINLKEGQQHLDGAKAQQLVRFRRYNLGDEQRVQVQQDFLKALASKVISSDVLIKKLPELIKTGYEYVETDISLADALKYASYVGDIDMSTMSTETLPGVGQYVGDVSYFLHDKVETKAAVKRVFFSDGVKEETLTDSKDKAIEVANGGSISGFAAENQQMLIGEGYNVTKISTYDGGKVDKTVIYVSEEGVGEDLKNYYPGSEIIVSSTSLGEGIDILIVLGDK